MKTLIQILLLKRNPDHDAIQQMNQEDKPFEKWKRWEVSFVKYITICILIGVILYRAVFDWEMYFYGETLEIRHESRSGYDYLLRLPPGYNAFSGKRPLLIYLHGAGEIGKDIAELKKSDPSVWSHNYVERKDYPFITVTPVTVIHGWNPKRLKILVEELLLNRDRFAIDETRVYLTGYSMGGFGTFETAENFPELFAAIVPVAGGGNKDESKRLKSMPIWAFHGDKDTAVPYSCSKKMIDAIEKSGNEHVRLTTYHGAGHGIVIDVYRNPKLYQWFLDHNTSKYNN